MWNDERTKLLKELCLVGLSGSEIAARLGGVSRNSVISKLMRMGLSCKSAAASRRVRSNITLARRA
jgi:GcrA cell cycle regulator